MAVLTNVQIQFNTHNDDKDSDTLLHVFVKNRVTTSLGSQGNSNFVANLLAWNDGLTADPNELNPYLAAGISLAQGTGFGDPSTSQKFELTLRAAPNSPHAIQDVDVVLPTVDIHILPNGDDQWEFDFTIWFVFDNDPKKTYSYSSNNNGVTGVVLDQDNKDYTCICSENPFNPQMPQIVKPVTNSVLKSVLLEIITHGDISDNSDNKDFDSVLNVHIVNRINASSSQDIAIGLNVSGNDQIPAGSYTSYTWSASALPLASNSIMLRDMILPIVNIVIVPKGNDTWLFDYKVTFEFDNGQRFSSQTNNIILNQNCTKFAGVYNGDSFPSMTPPTRPPLQQVPTNPPANESAKVVGTGQIDGTPIVLTQTIPISFLKTKLAEFINNRQATTGPNRPLIRLRFDNSGLYLDSTLPESYVNVRSLEANETGDAEYEDSPLVLGQEKGFHLIGNWNLGSSYFNDVNSRSVTLNVDTTQSAPLSLVVDFETDNTDGKAELIGMGNGAAGAAGGALAGAGAGTLIGGPVGGAIGGVAGGIAGGIASGSGLGTIDLTTLTLTLKLTLDCVNQKVDIMSWATTGNYQNYILVDAQGDSDLLSTFKSKLVDGLYSQLTTVDPFTNKTMVDSINASVNSILLGGFIDSTNTDNNNLVQSVKFDAENIIITYTGPKSYFEFQTPANWPAGVDFSPGNLANIDHIVVLTMENRSFDHMLGYLSLPTNKGGMGRTDVDGLKGGESNSYQGTSFPSFAFNPADGISSTVFSPDPPHSYEPVNKAINGGKMDDFVRSYAEKNGRTGAPRIMGHHSTATIPAYDALVRDFSFCHRWFAAHPGPTFCNRFYELSGRLNIDPEGFWEFSNSAHIRPSFAKTIFDHLSDATDPATGKPVTWNYFEDGYCFLRFFQKYTFDDQHIFNMNDSEFGFFARASSGNLPSVSFIDPHFVELPPGGNCDGPPADVALGQALVRKVVEAVVASPNWSKTLLIITYDEHGGFYDHVPPPPAVKVSPDSPISTYGVRVPAFVISPWVNAGVVFGSEGILVQGPVTASGSNLSKATTTPIPATPGSPAAAAGSKIAGIMSAAATRVPVATTAPQPNTVQATPSPSTADQVRIGGQFFDHTSILKTIARRFMSANPPYMGARYAAAHDLSSVIGTTARTSQFLPFIGYNIVYGASNKSLDVTGGSSAPGTALWQYDINNTDAQNFSFEDAGDGSFYIRTHCGNLYLTVDSQSPIVANPGNLTVASATPAAPPPSSTPSGLAGIRPVSATVLGTTATPPVSTTSVGIKQDVKYTGNVVGIFGNNANHQKWKLTPTSAIIAGNTYIITSVAFPNMVLQPLGNSSATEAAVVIDVPSPSSSPLIHTNGWKISSPLISSHLGEATQATV